MNFEFKLTIKDWIIDGQLVDELIEMGFSESLFERVDSHTNDFFNTISNTPCSLNISDLDFLSCYGTLTWEEGFILTLDCK